MNAILEILLNGATEQQAEEMAEALITLRARCRVTRRELGENDFAGTILEECEAFFLSGEELALGQA